MGMEFESARSFIAVYHFYRISIHKGQNYPWQIGTTLAALPAAQPDSFRVLNQTCGRDHIEKSEEGTRGGTGLATGGVRAGF